MNESEESLEYLKLEIIEDLTEVFPTEWPKIPPPDLPKTVFVAPFRDFEYLFVPFGLTNVHSTFQTLMNLLLCHLPFLFVYLNDILIFRKNVKEHAEHLPQVLTMLRAMICMQGWQSASSTINPLRFWAHHLLRWRSTLLRQNHCCKELDIHADFDWKSDCQDAVHQLPV